MNVLIVAATESEIISDKIRRKLVLITGIGMVNSAIKLTKELIKTNYLSINLTVQMILNLILVDKYITIKIYKVMVLLFY